MSSQALFPQQIWCFVRTRKREKDISIISATIYHDAATAHTTLSNNGRLMPAQNYARWDIFEFQTTFGGNWHCFEQGPYAIV